VQIRWFTLERPRHQLQSPHQQKRIITATHRSQTILSHIHLPIYNYGLHKKYSNRIRKKLTINTNTCSVVVQDGGEIMKGSRSHMGVLYVSRGRWWKAFVWLEMMNVSLSFCEEMKGFGEGFLRFNWRWRVSRDEGSLGFN
jgi:hypothetical protein